MDLALRSSVVRTVAAMIVTLSATAHATVEVNVTHVGIPTTRGDVVRSGLWAAIIVDLSLQNQPSFDGTIRVGQLDDDGDQCLDEVEVHLRSDTGGSQRLFLYVLANPQSNQGRYQVELFDEDGEAVRVVSQGALCYQASPAELPNSIGHDDVVILSLSDGVLGRVGDLTAPSEAGVYLRDVHVGHMSPAELPEQWIGLEIVDYIVWDDARPEQLTPRQLETLIQWVEYGGTLVIAASRSAGSIQLTDSLYRVLPVDLGEIETVSDLPSLRRELLGVDDEDPGFRYPVSAVACALRDGAKRIPDRAENMSNALTERPYGRGGILFLAVTLGDLFRGPGKAADFFRRLFHLSTISESEQSRPIPVSLFPQVVSAVGFFRYGSVYLLVAAILSIAYVIGATLGTWTLLGVKRWRHHSWSAFSCVAIACSLLAVAAVNVMRGFGESLHQVSVIDLRAGSGIGTGTAYFGLKTGTDRALDLWLPPDRLGAVAPEASRCFLRPLPVANDPTAESSSFADPEQYRLSPASAALENVRFRATLKRFEGRWSGPLGGTVTGEIAVANHRIQEGSFVSNTLGVDLDDCFLLQTRLPPSNTIHYRGGAVYAYAIGSLPGNGQRVDLVSRCYRPTNGETLAEFMQRSTLDRAQESWSREFGGLLSNPGFGRRPGTGISLGQEKNALLLLSTVGDYDPTGKSGVQAAIFGVSTWSRDRARQLDLRNELRTDSVVVIGFAEDPGPIRLFQRMGDRQYRVLEPDEGRSWTMYRIHIPVTIIGTAEPEETNEAPR